MENIIWDQQKIFEESREHGVDGLLQVRAALIARKDEAEGEEAKQVKSSIANLENEIFRKAERNGTFYVLYSAVTNRPYIECHDVERDFRAFAFTDKELADAYAEKLASEKYFTRPVEIVTGKRRADYYEKLMLCGVNFIILNPGDHEYRFSINMVAGIPSYDGYGGIQYPLINCKLNAILSDYCERAAAKTITKDFEQKVFEMIRSAYFVSPIEETGTVDQIDSVRISYNYTTVQTELNGITDYVMPIFTDYISMDEWMQSRGITLQGAVMRFNHLFDILNEQHIRKFVINCNDFNLVLTGETLKKIETAE